LLSNRLSSFSLVLSNFVKFFQTFILRFWGVSMAYEAKTCFLTRIAFRQVFKAATAAKKADRTIGISFTFRSRDAVGGPRGGFDRKVRLA
jgi:hypothetical protein